MKTILGLLLCIGSYADAAMFTKIAPKATVTFTAARSVLWQMHRLSSTATFSVNPCDDHQIALKKDASYHQTEQSCKIF